MGRVVWGGVVINWPVLKDAKWLLFQSTSILLATIGVTLAVFNNSYWVLLVVLSMLLMLFAVNRAAKITK